MNVLALDLGTKTGYCFNVGDTLSLGTWTLATDAEIKRWGVTRQRRTDDPRITRLCNKLNSLDAFDLVIFEDVEFASSTWQVQLWASLRASVWLCSKRTAIQCVPVGTLKKFATGDGSAKKEKMEKFFYRDSVTRPFQGKADDNAIDAYFLHKWATQHIKSV